METRPGSLALMHKALKAGIRVAVMSVSWSSEFVRAALAQQGLPVVVAGWDGAEAPSLDAVTVYANELEFFGEESTGNLVRRCESGADKARLFDDLILGLASEPGCADAETLYVGDSMTDITPLISADAGILVGSNDLARRLARAAGVRLAPLCAVPIEPLVPGAAAVVGGESPGDTRAARKRQGSGGGAEKKQAAAVAPTSAQLSGPFAAAGAQGQAPRTVDTSGASVVGPPALSRLSTVRPRAEDEGAAGGAPPSEAGGGADAAGGAAGGPTLYEAVHWSEIEALLFGGLFRRCRALPAAEAWAAPRGRCAPTRPRRWARRRWRRRGRWAARPERACRACWWSRAPTLAAARA